ncbi:MAG: exosortase/archaeosortase family protein [Candidatus Nanohaloarchaea archaeon]
MIQADDLRERWRTVRGGLTRRQEQLLEALLFLVTFTVLAAPFYALLNSGWDATGIRAATATAAAGLLDAIGIPATSTGPYLAAGDMLVDVTRDSTGWKSLLAFTGLVLATRPDRRQAVEGIVLGVVGVAAANLLRIVSMVVLVQRAGIPYDLLHLVMWRWGLTGILLLLWIGWRRHPRPVSTVYSGVRQTTG